MQKEDRVALVGHTETETARRAFVQALQAGGPSVAGIIAGGNEVVQRSHHALLLVDEPEAEAFDVDKYGRKVKDRHIGSTIRRHRNSHGFRHVQGNPDLEKQLAALRDEARRSSPNAEAAVDAAEARREARRKKRLAHAG